MSLILYEDLMDNKHRLRLIERNKSQWMRERVSITKTGGRLTEQHKQRIREALLAKGSKPPILSGEDSPRWKGGRMVKKGYVYLLRRDHPNSTKGGYFLEHRLVMEKHIGRLLKCKEVVHHKDGNTLNNSIENLELISSSGKHIAKYHTIRNKENGRFVKGGGAVWV